MTDSLCAACKRPGQCCEYVTLPARSFTEGERVDWVEVARPLTHDEREWIYLHRGLSAPYSAFAADAVYADKDIPRHHLKGQPGMPNPLTGRSITFKIACSALQPDGRCALYGSSDRPQMCERWPDQEAQVADLDGCAYQGKLKK